MSHRHITASTSYQPGDSFISASPATDTPNPVVYTLPQPPSTECRIEFFNVITPDEFPLVIDANGGQIDCMEQGGTQGGLVITAGRGVILRWISEVGRWAAIATS